MPSTYNRQDTAQKVSGDVSHHTTSARRIHLWVIIAADRLLRLCRQVPRCSDVNRHPSQSNVALQTPASKTKNVPTTFSNGFNIHPERTGTHQKVSGDVTHQWKSAPPNLSLSHP